MVIAHAESPEHEVASMARALRIQFFLSALPAAPLLAALAALSACASTTAGQHPSSNPEGVYLAVDLKQRDAYPQASATGTFEIIRGCVYLTLPGTAPLLPIFPKGTQLIGARGNRTLLLVRGSGYSLGKMYKMGGGGARESSSLSLAQPIPQRCTGRLFVVGTINEFRGSA